MTILDTITVDNTHVAFAGQLSIERCQCHLAHLQALIHMCCENITHSDDFIAQSVRSIIENIGQELEHSAKALSLFS